MNAAPPFTRADFEQLVVEHHRLIDAMNDLEFQLYGLGDSPADGRIADCQQAAGHLIRLLRDVLFRQDQQVLPLLEVQAGAANRTEPCS